MSVRAPMLCLLLTVLTFLPRSNAITNHDGRLVNQPPHLDSAKLDPEELLHDVIPCACVDIRLCPKLLNSLKHPVSASSVEIRHLQRFTCGFRGFTPFVCCNEMANTPMDRPTPPMSVVTATPTDPYVTSTPGEDKSKTFPFHNPTLRVPYDDTTVPSDFSDFRHDKNDASSTPSSYDPTQDIADTFGSPAVSPHTPSTPSDRYDPVYNTAKTLDTETGVNYFTTPNPYAPNENNDKGFISPGISGDNYPSTPPPHYDPTDDIASVFGNVPSVKTPDNPSTSTAAGPYDPTEDIAKTFGTPSVQHHYNPATPPSTYDPTEDIANTFGSPNINSNNNYPSTPSIPYDPSDDISKTFGSGVGTVPSTYNGHRDPPKEVIDTFGRPDASNNNAPSTTVSPYDPTHDIALTFGTRPAEVATLPPTYFDSYDTGDKYDSNGKSVPQSPHVNAVGPLIPIESPVHPFARGDLPKNQTEFKFHLETNDPSGNLTIHLNRLPFQGGRKPYYFPKATEVPPVTVSYNLNFQPTNIEKKYLLFKDFFYKSMNASKGFPDFKSNTNFLHPYYGNIPLITLPHSRESPDRDDNGYNKQVDPPGVIPYLLQAPRPTSTNRYIRQYNPSDYYHFTPRHYYPQYYRASTGTTHPYYTVPSNHPYYAGSATHKVSSVYPSLNYKPTPVPDYDYPEDEPVTAKPNQYGYQHHLHNRGINRGWERGGNTHHRGKPTTDNGAIVFPNDNDDETPPTRFHHHPPNANSAHYPGSFYSTHHRPSRPNFPQWGFNNVRHTYPDYHNHDNNDYDNDDVATTVPPKPVVTVTTLPPVTIPVPATLAQKPTPVTTPATTPAAMPATPATPVTASLTSVTMNANATAATAATAGTELVTKIAASPEGRLAKRQLLPGDACGVSVDERIIGGKAAALGAYPWIARIGYLRNGTGRVLYRCAATLINSVYVITAAHCVSKLPTGLVLTTVRLGEADETTDPDCNANECAEPVQDFTPARIDVHTGYDTPQFKNDVGLIRLDRPVSISTYVSPICLPFDSLSTKNYTGLKATVAGWGASNVGAPSANPILQWVRLTIASLTRCAATFASRSGVDVGVGQLCAGGEKGRDSCEGDSGGPLMRPEQPTPDSSPRYFLIGIVSFGAKRCGSDNMPGVYTNVASYLDWILDTIQA